MLKNMKNDQKDVLQKLSIRHYLIGRNFEGRKLDLVFLVKIRQIKFP